MKLGYIADCYWNRGLDRPEWNPLGCHLNAPPPLPPAWATSSASQSKITSRAYTGNVQEGKLIHKTAPKFSELARQMRWRPPFVQLQVTVSEAGKIENVKITRGHPLCDDAVREALKQWRYTPTVWNGTPVKVIFNMRLPCGDPFRGKLDPAVALLMHRLGKGTPADPVEKTFVKDGMVLLDVTLSSPPQHSARVLRQLGFLVTGQTSRSTCISGRIPIERLAPLCASTAVSYVAPHTD